MHSYGSNTSIRLIIRNFFPVMHNMHLHGHTSYWVLAEGRGDWDGTIVRPENPQRRDGQQLMMGTPDMPAYIVIQFEADNPGVWALHCHYVVHGSAGMYWNIIVSLFSPCSVITMRHECLLTSCEGTARSD